MTTDSNNWLIATIGATFSIEVAAGTMAEQVQVHWGALGLGQVPGLAGRGMEQPAFDAGTQVCETVLNSSSPLGHTLGAAAAPLPEHS
jgi:hypothetical protein